MAKVTFKKDPNPTGLFSHMSREELEGRLESAYEAIDGFREAVSEVPMADCCDAMRESVIAMAPAMAQVHFHNKQKKELHNGVKNRRVRPQA